jgi:multimeric flavodoxin WrbA
MHKGLKKIYRQQPLHRSLGCDLLKVLGLIGSYRKLGNTEVLVKEALMEAQKLGADVDALHLTDLKIEPCKGCMLAFSNKKIAKSKMIGIFLKKSLKKAMQS